MSSNERIFYSFLMEKKRQGYWDVDVFHLGGTRETRRGWGVDFVLYSVKEGRKGTLWIEHKHSPHFQFTKAQILRFYNSHDTDWNATRFIGIAHRSSDVNGIKFLLYWTPNFIRSLLTEPFNFFTDRGDTWYLVTDGLAHCIEEFTYTQYKWQYTESDWATIRATPNLTVHDLSYGEFGRPYSGYNVFPLSHALEILFSKLRSTLDNLGEDKSNTYPVCKKHDRPSEKFSDYIAECAEEIIFQHYRTVFMVDIRDELVNDPNIKQYLEKNNETGRIMIGGALLKDVVRRELRQLERVGKVQNYAGKGWGITGRSYVLFESNPILSSRFLDSVRETFWYKTERGNKNPWIMTLPEIMAVTGLGKGVITTQRTRSEDDLVKTHKLMRTRIRWDENRRARVREIYLTLKGRAYITRNYQWTNSK